MAYRRIVVATDGSASAETAEHVAVALASAVKARLTVAHAYTDPSRADSSVARALRIAEGDGLKVEVALSADEPAEAIIVAAAERDADLIVIGSVGFSTSEQLFGSVPRKVVTHAPCDVLLTRPRGEGERRHGSPPYRHLLIATDGSATADRAARKGYALAKRLKASVTLLFVGHPKTGELVLQDTVATVGEEAGVPSATQIRSGDPVQEIVAAAAAEGSDLLVIGNRGMAGAKATLLGSIPRDVAESSPVDVLVARTIAQSLEEIGPGEGGIVASGDLKIAVYRDKKGRTTTLSARCTHMGCTVKWNPAEATWDCPCHGSRFAPAGEVMSGPAERPLPRAEL
jgi:nucleotide-binding universal stress UspA family protein/nitrite reductase/ring-hydroxylating ferredoxin subunit